MREGSTDHLEHRWVDSADTSVYVLRIPDAPSVADVVEFCAVLERFLAVSPERFGWITDLEQLRSVGAVQRRAFFDSNQRVRERLQARVIAMAVVAPTAFQRGLITAFHWFVPTKFPLQAFPNLAEAKAWVVEQMRSA